MTYYVALAGAGLMPAANPRAVEGPFWAVQDGAHPSRGETVGRVLGGLAQIPMQLLDRTLSGSSDGMKCVVGAAFECALEAL